MEELPSTPPSQVPPHCGYLFWATLLGSFICFLVSEFEGGPDSHFPSAMQAVGLIFGFFALEKFCSIAIALSLQLKS